MSAPSLSLVVPLYNEEKVVPELAGRLRLAGEAAGLPFEVVLVDDRSTDGTRALLEELGQAPPFFPVRLEQNRGQLGATMAGLAAARGEMVCVLDGDLQDPPEIVPELARALTEADPGVQVVFAVKSGREDPLWFLAGRAAFRLAERLLAGGGLPDGAGSYCLMRGEVAKKVTRVALAEGNLAAVLAALKVKAVAVPYRKEARYDGKSRVGPWRLAREAWFSLAVTGGVERAWVLLAVGLAALGAWEGWGWWVAAGVCAGMGWRARRWRRGVVEGV